jgi:predicted enzyme related to lactoylglutathione lyase
MVKNILIAALSFLLLFILASAKMGESQDHYFVVHYTTGSKWNKKLDFEKQPYSASHSKYLSALKKNGTIIFGMRYSDKGMLCIKAKDLNAAKQIINSDTAVIEELFKTDIQPADVFYDGCVVAEPDTAYRKVIGVGGIFFKTTNVKATNEWYYKNLGLIPNESGSLMEFRSATNPNVKGYLQWSPFNEKTKYFLPSEKQFMINYRVQNLEKLKMQLEANGVQILDKIESYEYGKFLHIMDLDGNKIELWEPVDTEFTRMYEGKTTK